MRSSSRGYAFSRTDGQLSNTVESLQDCSRITPSGNSSDEGVRPLSMFATANPADTVDAIYQGKGKDGVRRREREMKSAGMVVNRLANYTGVVSLVAMKLSPAYEYIHTHTYLYTTGMLASLSTSPACATLQAP